MSRILVVDDEPQILRALRINLSVRGYEVVTASTGAGALRAAAERPPDVVVLDLGLPTWTAPKCLPAAWLVHGAGHRAVGAHGFRGQGRGSRRRCGRLRHQAFGMDEFLARVRAAARRGGTSAADTSEPSVETASFTVDLAAKTVSRRGEQVHLTPTEWGGMLEMLVRNRGKLVGQKELLREVWGPAYDTETHYLRVYLAQLRRKLEDDPANPPKHLITEAGMGYRFVV